MISGKGNHQFPKILLLNIILVIILISNVSTSATSIKKLDENQTIYVDDNATPEWYDETHVKTINEGINNASEGDTVFVYNGTYFERVLINKKINLEGEDKNNTIIDSQQKGAPVAITSNNVNVSGFTLTNSSSESQNHEYMMIGIDIWSDGNKISNNIITKHMSGIYIRESSRNKIKNNIITENKLFDTLGEGIVISESTNNEIIGNTLTNNGVGVYVFYNSEENKILNNDIRNNIRGAYIKTSSSNEFSTNEFKENSVGIYFHNSKCNDVINNNFIDNEKDATFKVKSIFHRNKWNGNYWGEPRILPKIIFGRVGRLFSLIIWVNLDWSPADDSYEI
jgi:parallel beta-helix repeat protein